MSLLKEYIDKGLSVQNLERDLLNLIKQYNELKKTYLFVYSAAIEKQIQQLSLDQADYYTIFDLLKNEKKSEQLDFYLETPGGSGEAAEEIVRFIRNKYQKVHFVIAGEAKSAGTIIVMSGDEMYMTETASLGPIDAQIKIGRTIVSAHDYMEWIDKRRKEAGKKGAMNPFDAVMVAQISPGELLHVKNALSFAEDLVKEWLPKYKFRNWVKTETRQKNVTAKMRTDKAMAIAKSLTNHSHWRSHGRSLKIADLNSIGLRINKIDDDAQLSDIVYRIHVVCRLLFQSSPIYKIFATADNKIFRVAQKIPQNNNQPALNLKEVEGVNLDVACEKCNKIHKIYAQFKQNEKVADNFNKQGMRSFPTNGIIKCECGFEMILHGLRNAIELESGRKIIS